MWIIKQVLRSGWASIVSRHGRILRTVLETTVSRRGHTGCCRTATASLNPEKWFQRRWII